MLRHILWSVSRMHLVGCILCLHDHILLFQLGNAPLYQLLGGLCTQSNCSRQMCYACTHSYVPAGRCATHILIAMFLQAARNQGFTFGVQFRPEGLVSFPTEYLQHRSLSQLPQDAAQHISYALAYSPEGQSTFGEPLNVYHCRLMARLAFDLSGDGQALLIPWSLIHRAPS